MDEAQMQQVIQALQGGGGGQPQLPPDPTGTGFGMPGADLGASLGNQPAPQMSPSPPGAGLPGMGDATAAAAAQAGQQQPSLFGSQPTLPDAYSAMMTPPPMAPPPAPIY